MKKTEAKTKKISAYFEVTNTLSFNKIVEVPVDANEDEIQNVIEHYARLQNWGDLDEMFNLEGEPEFNCEWDAVTDKKAETQLHTKRSANGHLEIDYAK